MPKPAREGVRSPETETPRQSEAATGLRLRVNFGILLYKFPRFLFHTCTDEKMRNGVKSQHLTFVPSNSWTALIEKFTHFPQHLIEFRSVHLSNRVKNDPVINCEKSLRTNEALLGELSVFEIGTIQRNGESIEVRPAGNLAENQILAWKILYHQSGPVLSAGDIGPRKRYDNDFAGYRFDHAASSCGEFQSSARTDSLSSAPLNPSFSMLFAPRS